jgi:DNA-binding response OmpR family regulator
MPSNRADYRLSTVPIMLLSALRKDTESVLQGLQAGADDYLEAPLSRCTYRQGGAHDRTKASR